MVRVVARVQRFINFGRRRELELHPTLCLSVTEMDYAIRSIVLESQRIHFSALLHELSTDVRVSSKSP